MQKILYEDVIRPYRTLVEKWTHTETGNGGDDVFLSHRFTNGSSWLTYIFALDQQISRSETGGLFLYDRSGVVPEEFRVEEGGGSHCSGGDLNGRKVSPSSKRAKRMDEFKELMQASLGFAAESGLFGAPDPATARKESPVKAILEELRDVQVQIGEWRKMEADSFGVSDVDPDSSDDDGDGISTFQLAIKELKERKKELKLELNNYQKERAERALAK